MMGWTRRWPGAGDLVCVFLSSTGARRWLHAGLPCVELVGGQLSGSWRGGEEFADGGFLDSKAEASR